MEQLYGQVKIPCVAGLEGATATVSTIKGFSKTITLHSPITDIKLPGMDEYTITQGTSNKVKFTLDCGEYKKTEQFILVPANLNDASWELIQQLIQEGTFGNYYMVGDYKNVTLTDGQVMKMVVASINDGTTLATYYPNKTVDFISQNLINGVYTMDSYPSNKNPGDCSLVQTELNQTIYNKLSLDVKSRIIKKTHVYFNHAGSSSTKNLNLWFPTAGEVGFSQTYDSSDFNKIYSLLNTNAKRIKSSNDGTATDWWLMSTKNSSSYNSWFQIVTSSGEQKTNISGSLYSHGIPLCFRVG